MGMQLSQETIQQNMPSTNQVRSEFKYIVVLHFNF